MTFEEILKTSMTLSGRDRLKLAMELLDSIPDEHPGLDVDGSAFLDELDRRVNAGGPRIPWEVVEKELEADLNS